MTHDRDDIATRKAAKARWAAIQARAEARAYREHLAMLEPEEPLFQRTMPYATEQTGD